MRSTSIVDSEQKGIKINKTDNALFDALSSMLNRQNFNTITINALCSEALVSRATFYGHFSDKYDLLERVLKDIRHTVVKDIYNYDELEREINLFVGSHCKSITNVLKDANSETLGLVRAFFSSVVDLMVKRNPGNSSSSEHVVFSNFVIGGLANLLTWMVENNFPPEIDVMNPYLYEMLQVMTLWDAKRND